MRSRASDFEVYSWLLILIIHFKTDSEKEFVHLFNLIHNTAIFTRQLQCITLIRELYDTVNIKWFVPCHGTTQIVYSLVYLNSDVGLLAVEDVEKLKSNTVSELKDRISLLRKDIL